MSLHILYLVISKGKKILAGGGRLILRKLDSKIKLQFVRCSDENDTISQMLSFT